MRKCCGQFESDSDNECILARFECLERKGDTIEDKTQIVEVGKRVVGQEMHLNHYWRWESRFWKNGRDADKFMVNVFDQHKLSIRHFERARYP